MPAPTAGILFPEVRLLDKLISLDTDDTLIYIHVVLPSISNIHLRNKISEDRDVEAFTKAHVCTTFRLCLAALTGKNGNLKENLLATYSILQCCYRVRSAGRWFRIQPLGRAYLELIQRPKGVVCFGEALAANSSSTSRREPMHLPHQEHVLIIPHIA